MNIFVTDPCPIISAQALDNKRAVKMILETAQLLSSAIFINSKFIYGDIYKPTHLKHPCTIWAAESSGNWEWLREHFIALCEKYTFRYNKEHKSQKLLPHLMKYRVDIKPGPILHLLIVLDPSLCKWISEILKMSMMLIENICLQNGSRISWSRNGFIVSPLFGIINHKLNYYNNLLH